MSIETKTLGWLKFIRFIKPVLLPCVTMMVVATAIYYALSVFFINEAEEKIKNILLSHRGLHRYIQKIMHSEFYRARDNGEVAENYYSPEIFSSSYIVRNMHAFYNEELKKDGLPEIYYKMASVNPRNPVNMADAFEISLIRLFNENRDIHEFRKVLNIDGKKYLYYAIPFLETSSTCIRCHGKKEDAPQGLQVRYPGEGGFNEKTGVFRSIESIRVPISDEISNAVIVSCSLSAGVLVTIILIVFNRRLKVVVDEKTSRLEAEVYKRRKREDELEVKNSELERFSYTVSHDLKSPLITIKGFVGSIEKDLQKGKYERLPGDLKRVSDAADKMDALLHDLLALSTIGHAVNASEPADMNVIVSDVLAQLTGLIEKHDMNITVQAGLPTVSCDRFRMAEVVQNLVENAIKYMGAQAEPNIFVGARKEGELTVFFVQDNGIGIDEKYHQIVFGLFNKLDAKSDGTGVGLALVKRIIDAHGGRVWVESEGAGKGSRFCFTVPQEPESDDTALPNEI